MVIKNTNNKILAILFIGVLMGALDISIVGPAIPAIENSINVDKQLVIMDFFNLCSGQSGWNISNGQVI